MPDFTIAPYFAAAHRATLCWWIRESYWGAWQSEHQIRAAFAHSMIYVALVPGAPQPVGFIRVVTDYATFSAVTDLYVDEPHRRKGIARMLIEYVLRETCVKETICILASRDARGLYEKFGWRGVGGDVMQRNPSA